MLEMKQYYHQLIQNKLAGLYVLYHHIPIVMNLMNNNLRELEKFMLLLPML